MEQPELVMKFLTVLEAHLIKGTLDSHDLNRAILNPQSQRLRKFNLA